MEAELTVVAEGLDQKLYHMQDFLQSTKCLLKSLEKTVVRAATIRQSP